MSPRATSKLCSLQKPCLQQGWEHVSATAHHTQKSSSSAGAALAATGLQAQHQVLQNFTFFCFLATNKPSISMWTWKSSVCMGLSWCPCWKSSRIIYQLIFWRHDDGFICSHSFTGSAEVSKKRFVYEVWFISWREETALFFGNGLAPIHCITNPCFITCCAKHTHCGWSSNASCFTCFLLPEEIQHMSTLS